MTNWNLSLLLAVLSSSVMAQTILPGVYSECAKPGQFALTFDDGPSPFTAQLLQILDEERVPATFFVLGSQIAQPELQPSLKAAYDRGHQIAVHTYSHANLTTLTLDQVRDEMTSTDDIMRKVIGVSPFYMRPPFGDINEDTMTVLKDELDYAVVQWSLDSNDWRMTGKPKKGKSVVQSFKKVLGGSGVSKANSTFISLQHDILDFSVNKTRQIIQEIRNGGFELVTVSTCLGSPKPQYRNAPDGVPNFGQAAAASAKADPSANPLLKSKKKTVHSDSKTKSSSANSLNISWSTMATASATALLFISRLL